MVTEQFGAGHHVAQSVQQIGQINRWRLALNLPLYGRGAGGEYVSLQAGQGIQALRRLLETLVLLETAHQFSPWVQFLSLGLRRAWQQES